MTEDDVENLRSHAHMLLLAVEAGDPKPELLMRVNDMVKALPPPALDMEKVEKALEDAAEAIDYWGNYASAYLREKHDLAGDIEAARAVLSEIRKARGKE